MRIRPARVTLFLVVFALVLVSLAPRLLAAGPPQTLGIHVVREGDTLWGLARRFASSQDPRAYVQRLSEINQLVSPRVFPGQRLLLPAP